MRAAAQQSAPASARCAARCVAVRRAAQGRATKTLRGGLYGRHGRRQDSKRGTLMKKSLVAALIACSLAACAQPPVPQPQAAAPPPPAEPPAPAPAPRVTSEAQIAP